MEAATPPSEYNYFNLGQSCVRGSAEKKKRADQRRGEE
jgi:hypothetical protein